MNNKNNFSGHDHTVIVGNDDTDLNTVMYESSPGQKNDTFYDAEKKIFSGDGTLLSVTTPALMLISRINNIKENIDPNLLKQSADKAMQNLHSDIIKIGLKAGEARIAHYFICATIDDIALNSPWGRLSSWTKNSMVSTFHIDAEGGDRVLELAESMRKNPAKYRDLLELAYLCVSLGFEGRFRVTPNGQTELKSFRESLYLAVAQLRRPAAADLSPHWRGAEIPLAARRRTAPL
ncbi:MAG TPA: type IVB secretion system protein IcmH/DotU, partial [Azospirillaceae bacterium]|nr:type IVB secretion system protein IcmH/DotU [Azospirillaceae bacterium]